jgi:hypothetical protein
VKCYNTVRTTTSLQALVSVYHYQKMEYPRVAKTLGAGTRALRDVPPRRWYSGKYTQEKSVRDWVLSLSGGRTLGDVSLSPSETPTQRCCLVFRVRWPLRDTSNSPTRLDTRGCYGISFCGKHHFFNYNIICFLSKLDTHNHTKSDKYRCNTII